MKVGNIITLNGRNANGKLFKVIEVVRRRKAGITEIVFHPIGNPNKWHASWKRYYDVVKEK